MKNNVGIGLFVFTTVLLVAACSSSYDESGARRNGGTPGASGDGGAAAGTGPGGCGLGRNYVGYENIPLDANRAPTLLGTDRRRLKPYAVFASEYLRVLGNVPPIIITGGSTFGALPDRFWAEPTSNAISIATSFRGAFTGCLTYVGGKPDFAAAPASDTAEARCRGMQRAFWSRDASVEEAAACVDLAVEQTKTEPNVQRRWAYVCASILNASGFLTY